MSDIRIEYEFDNISFMVDIRHAVGALNGEDAGKVSTRDIEAVTGVSASTISRIDNGASIDLSTFLQICARCKLKPGAYFKETRWQKLSDQTP